MTLPRVKNYNVAVREWHGRSFACKILHGTVKIYGIQVARLAGLPKEVLARAKEVLNNLEEAGLSVEGERSWRSGKKKSGGRRERNYRCMLSGGGSERQNLFSEEGVRQCRKARWM